MVSAATQAKVEADNSRLEGAVRVAIDEIDKVLMRPIAKRGLQCSLKCYDTAGSHGTSDVLQQCVQTCEQPHQKANAIVRQVCFCVRILVLLNCDSRWYLRQLGVIKFSLVPCSFVLTLCVSP